MNIDILTKLLGEEYLEYQDKTLKFIDHIEAGYHTRFLYSMMPKFLLEAMATTITHCFLNHTSHRRAALIIIANCMILDKKADTILDEICKEVLKNKPVANNWVN